MGVMGSAGSLVIQFVFGLLMFVVLLRLLMQAFRAPFHHPASQSIFKLTNPLFMPLQKVLPVVRGWHLGGLLVLWLLATIEGWLMLLLGGGSVAPMALLVFGLGLMLDFVFMTLFWLVLVRVLVSWLAPGSRSAPMDILNFVTKPLLAPFKRYIPPIGPFDISPMVLLLLIQIARIVIPGPLMALALSMSLPVAVG
ncbi:MAG: YggT family protein [Ahniella sp.]|nr:YggT family protein [Ahniella sp.]